MPIDPETELRRARALIRPAVTQSAGLCVLTGAGMSAESGIATFRDALTGHGAKFDPLQLASADGFRAAPQRVWDWYVERRVGVLKAQPNAGHVALAGFAQRHPGVMSLISKNVDDLHQRAGYADTIRLHGSILEDRWFDDCPHLSTGGMGCAPELAGVGRPPRCGDCGNSLRPGVVWFGEPLPQHAINAAEAAVDRCAVMLVVGTSGAVWPAAGLASRARRRGASVVILNPAKSEIDAQAHLLLRGMAAEILPALLA